MKKITATLLTVAVMLAFSFFPTPVVAAAPTDALSCWDLNEASGQRIDNNGSNNAQDHNTVTSAAGIVGDAALFASANEEILYIENPNENPDLSIGTGDFAVAAWFYAETDKAIQTLIGKYENFNGGREWWLFYWDDGSTIDFTWRAFNNTTGNSQVKSTNIADLSTGTWYFVYAYVDQTANQIGLSVNDGTVSTASLTVTTHDGTGDFLMGAQNNITTPAQLLNGRLDIVEIYDRTLTSAEVTALYNSGAGVACDDRGGGGEEETPTTPRSAYFGAGAFFGAGALR